MEFVDTHCHLQFEKYRARVDLVLADASRLGVKKIICVGTTLDDSKAGIELAKGKKGVWATAGVHPHDAAQFVSDSNGPKKLEAVADQPRVVAVGETGLDYYRNVSPKADQQRALREHIKVGIELGLPLVFHIRDSWEEYERPVANLAQF